MYIILWYRMVTCIQYTYSSYVWLRNWCWHQRSGAQVTLPTQRTIGMKLRNGGWVRGWMCCAAPGMGRLPGGWRVCCPRCLGHGSTPPQDVSWSTYLGWPWEYHSMLVDWEIQTFQDAGRKLWKMVKCLIYCQDVVFDAFFVSSFPPITANACWITEAVQWVLTAGIIEEKRSRDKVCMLLDVIFLCPMTHSSVRQRVLGCLWFSFYLIGSIGRTCRWGVLVVYRMAIQYLLTHHALIWTEKSWEKAQDQQSGTTQVAIALAILCRQFWFVSITNFFFFFRDLFPVRRRCRRCVFTFTTPTPRRNWSDFILDTKIPPPAMEREGELQVRLFAQITTHQNQSSSVRDIGAEGGAWRKGLMGRMWQDMAFEGKDEYSFSL